MLNFGDCVALGCERPAHDGLPFCLWHCFAIPDAHLFALRVASAACRRGAGEPILYADLSVEAACLIARDEHRMTRRVMRACLRKYERALRSSRGGR